MQFDTVDVGEFAFHAVFLPRVENPFSKIPRDRTAMWRFSVRQIKQYFIDITPAPSFRRIIALDDRVSGQVEMLGRVFVGRIVAAPDMAASSADAQMQPYTAALQALLATERARHDVADAGDVCAALCHLLPAAELMLWSFV
jgi:hypothetical protein